MNKSIKMKTKSARRTFIQTSLPGTAALTTGISKASASEKSFESDNKQKHAGVKMHEHHFYKADWEEHDRLIEVDKPMITTLFYSVFLN
jgi:hypothetical protein